jgi:hypothetical protein
MNADTRVERPRPKIVCLCGSTRFRPKFVDETRKRTLDGEIVLAPGVYIHAGEEVDDETKKRLDELHLAKIDLADEIHVINPGGYIGESTAREIEYAQRTGKRVSYLLPPQSLERESDE